MKAKIIFFASLLALSASCNKESYIEGVTIIPTNNTNNNNNNTNNNNNNTNNNNNNNNGNFNGNGGLNASQIANILATSSASRTWRANPNGSTVYCNNGIINPPLAMDDTWQFVYTGQFAHVCGTVTTDNATHCSDGGTYTSNWVVSADNKAIIINGVSKKLIHISEYRIILADGNYQDDLISN